VIQFRDELNDWVEAKTVIKIIYQKEEAKAQTLEQLELISTDA